MKPPPGNDRSEIEQVLTALIQKASSSKVFGAARSMSSKMLEAARERIRRSYPNASDEEIAEMVLERFYGKRMAERFRTEMEKRRSR